MAARSTGFRIAAFAGWLAVAGLAAGSASAQPVQGGGPAGGQATRPASTVLLTPEIMQPLVLKVYGRTPELTPQMINPSIMNQQLQQHADLVRRYEAVSAQATYRTPNINTRFISVPAQHLLQVAWLQVNHSDNYFVDPSLNIAGTPITFANASEFQRIDLSKVPLSNRYLQDLAANARQNPGSVVIELKFLGPDVSPTLLPTVTPVPPSREGGRLLATATKVTFFTPQNQRFYEVTLPPPAPAQDPVAEANRLAASGEPGDFDLFGVRTTMTLDEVKQLAAERGWWTRDLGRFGARDWSKFVVGNGECQVRFFSGLAMAMAPTEPGLFCLTVLYRGQQVVGLEGATTLGGTVEERRQLVLGKYGAPFSVAPRDRRLFLWGRRNDASAKDEVTNEVPHSVFQMSVQERYSTSPPPAGVPPDRWDVTSKVYLLPTPTPAPVGRRPASGPGTL